MQWQVWGTRFSVIHSLPCLGSRRPARHERTSLINLLNPVGTKSCISTAIIVTLTGSLFASTDPVFIALRPGNPVRLGMEALLFVEPLHTLPLRKDQRLHHVSSDSIGREGSPVIIATTLTTTDTSQALVSGAGTGMQDSCSSINRCTS